MLPRPRGRRRSNSDNGRESGTSVAEPDLIREVSIFSDRSDINEEITRLRSHIEQFHAFVHEAHHSAKKDAPSGTLLKLVEEMRKAGYGRNIDVGSNRAGAIPGTHEIGFDSAADTITLRHTARSREGFARGALKAAQWVIGKAGIFKM